MHVPKDVQITASSRLNDVLNEQEVDGFLTSQPFSTPFDSWAWLSAADDAIEDNEKCFAVARSPNGHLLGWLPLRADTEAFLGQKIRVLRLLTDPKSDRHSLQVKDARVGLLTQLVDAAKTHVNGWSAILLDEMTGAQFKGTNLSNWSVTHKRNVPVYHFPQTELASPTQLIGKRGRRARKKLEKVSHQFKIWRPSIEELDQLMNDIRGVEMASWKGEQGVGIFSSDTDFKFCKAVATLASAAGSLLIATVRIEEKLASYRFGFVWRDVFYDYNFAYLPEYSNLSLGRVLLDEMIVRGPEIGLRGIDGSRVGASYENLLRERSEDGVEHRRWIYFRWTFGGFLLCLKFRVLKRVKRILKGLRK